MTDYTEQIVAACEDAIERFPEMPVIVYQALCNYILTGELTGDEPYEALDVALTSTKSPRLHLYSALISLMPSMTAGFDSWEKHLASYYANAEKYEETKADQHGLH